MSVINTGNHPKEHWPGIYKLWGMTYNEHPLECADLFDKHKSGKLYEEVVEQIGFGLAPVKPQGNPLSYDSTTQGSINRATHVTYGIGYAVTYEELITNLYMEKSAGRAKANAFSMRQTKENVMANVYNRAFNSSYVFGDGVELLSTAHPTANGTQSNELATPADLSEQSLEDLTIQIMTATNSRGLRIGIMPQSLHVPPALFYEANRILKSTLQSGTANNDMNVLKSQNVFPKGIKVNHYFSDDDAYFIRTNVPDALLWFQLLEPKFDKDNDFNTKDALASSIEMYSNTISDWRGLYGSAGA